MISKQSLLKKFIGVSLALSLCVAASFIFLLRPAEDEIEAHLIPEPDENTPQIVPAGFERAYQPIPLQFPEDFGAHPDFQTEWWYYTGNLTTEEGRQFGYQLTFFRRALSPPQLRESRQSDWATEQVYLAHFAITDVNRDEHRAFERYARGAAGLAGARSDPYQVWLEDWSVMQTDEGKYSLRAAQDGWTIYLILNDAKGPILQGDRGYSQKGPQTGNASFYISQTRLQTKGTIMTGGDSYEVAGTSWMDHEFSTSALSEDQVGWDWFALQLDDGSELMLFTIRKADGSIDPFSSGTVVYQDGTTRTLNHADFQVEVLDTWQSPESEARYPSRWKIAVPLEELSLEIQPYIKDQELNLAYEYWEGAVRILGDRLGESIGGNGYVELTGYAGSFAGEF